MPPRRRGTRRSIELVHSDEESELVPVERPRSRQRLDSPPASSRTAASEQRLRFVDEQQEDDEKFAPDAEGNGDDLDSSHLSQSHSARVAPPARANITEEEVQKYTSDLVRHILFLHTKKQPFAKTDLRKVVADTKRGIGAYIFEMAKGYFLDIFGYKLVELPRPEATKSKSTAGSGRFVLINGIEDATHLSILNTQDQTESARRGFLLVALAIVHVAKGHASEDEFWRAMVRMGIDRRTAHPLLGDCDALVSQLVKQNYLDRVRNADVLQGDAAAYEFRAGPRSRAEINHTDVLKFISKVYELDEDSERIFLHQEEKRQVATEEENA